MMEFVNGKDYPIYYGKETCSKPPNSQVSWYSQQLGICVYVDNMCWIYYVIILDTYIQSITITALLSQDITTLDIIGYHEKLTHYQILTT